MIKIILNITLLFTSLLITTGESPLFADAHESISKVDEIRFPNADYTADVKITRVKPGRDNKVFEYDLMVKGRDMALLVSTEPKNERGRVVLMKGYDTWIYLPTISQPVRLSLRERLLGEVAVGDIARANYSGDYDSEFVKEEEVKGKMYKVFDLKAKHDKIPYPKVRLWAETDSLNPYQAQFFGNSGKLLKSATYGKYDEVADGYRPTRLVMIDPIKKGQYTVVDYRDIKIEEIPEQYFTSAYISRLSK